MSNKEKETNDAHTRENLKVETTNQTLSKEAIRGIKDVYNVDSFTWIFFWYTVSY